MRLRRTENFARITCPNARKRAQPIDCESSQIDSFTIVMNQSSVVVNSVAKPSLTSTRGLFLVYFCASTGPFTPSADSRVHSTTANGQKPPLVQAVASVVAADNF